MFVAIPLMNSVTSIETCTIGILVNMVPMPLEPLISNMKTIAAISACNMFQREDQIEIPERIS